MGVIGSIWATVFEAEATRSQSVIHKSNVRGPLGSELLKREFEEHVQLRELSGYEILHPDDRALGKHAMHLRIAKKGVEPPRLICLGPAESVCLILLGISGPLHLTDNEAEQLLHLSHRQYGDELAYAKGGHEGWKRHDDMKIKDLRREIIHHGKVTDLQSKLTLLNMLRSARGFPLATQVAIEDRLFAPQAWKKVRADHAEQVQTTIAA